MKKGMSWAILGIIVLLGALPFFVGNFFITMLIRIMYYGLLSVAFSFLAGQLGLFSLMVPVAFALSGYTIAILEYKAIMFFPYSMFAGIVVALIFSAFFGILVNRSKGTYFLMLTLMLGQLLYSIVLQWVDLTKGSNGITGIETPKLLGGGSNIGNSIFYYVLAGVFVLCLIGLYALIRSPYGLRLRGIRESESRMIMLGYNVPFLKWSAFMVSSFIASLAGIFFVYFTGLMNPDSINLTATNNIMIASIFGGIESLIGAVIGTGVIKTFEIVLSGITQRYLLIIGVTFLIVILYAPNGLIGIIEKMKNKLKKN